MDIFSEEDDDIVGIMSGLVDLAVWDGVGLVVMVGDDDVDTVVVEAVVADDVGIAV